MPRILLALAATQLLAFAAFAQSDAAEFGRGSGGAISAITKAPRQFSGTLSLTHATGGEGYGGSLGGEVLKDRMWFFAAASILPPVQFSTTPNLTAIDAKVTAQPVDWTNITASYIQLQQPDFATALPSSFLSLRSTSILSDRMSMDISVSRTRTGAQ